ncbi:MAG: DUF4125 family protein [Clostridiales Family XIII bacterium]|jgi:hypothetical protein|nr:DUF4125 family protein [Clostridiales Family XIII bacterium]
MHEKIDEIIASEWLMFDQTQNIGGRAPCQDDLRTFAIMRKGQLSAWDDVTLESYHRDILEAETHDRNLISEKYAYMMRDTSPAEFARIAHLLPTVTDEKLSLIMDILPIFVIWQEELALQYPTAIDKARPIHARDDTPYSVSFETYTKGELMTYSIPTLTSLNRYTHQLLERGHNMNIDILHHMARLNSNR